MIANPQRFATMPMHVGPSRNVTFIRATVLPVAARISFKKMWIEPILQGHKTQTMRSRKPKYEVGDRVAATCEWGKPPFCELVVADVERISLDQITDQVARADGFASAVELREFLEATYPDIEDFWITRWEALSQAGT